MILIIDNYDSFVHNLARYIRLLGYRTMVVRDDRVDDDLIQGVDPSHVVISPGPCSPARAVGSCGLVARHAARFPILGVCLGHQCIGAAFGMPIGRAMQPVHGKSSKIFHSGDGIFRGLPSPLTVGRYHSLALAADDLPDELEMVASTAAGEVMAIRHRELPVWGLQFHPESILTEHGSELLAAFLQLTPTR